MGGGRGSSRVARGAKRPKPSIAVESPQQMSLPSRPLEVFGVTSPGHTSQQAGGSAESCSASQRSPDLTDKRKLSDSTSQVGSSGESHGPKSDLHLTILKECFSFKLKLAKLEKILKCKPYDESVTKDEVLQVRSEALTLSKELSYFQIRLLEEGMDVYSSVESRILLAEEGCRSLLKQCEMLVSKFDQNQEKIGCQGAGATAGPINKAKGDNVEVKQSTLNPFANPYHRTFDGSDKQQAQSKQYMESAPFPVSSRVPFGGYNYGNPVPRLSLEKFDGDILKYHTFKRKFKSCVEEAYQDYNVRMSFLEESCIGKAFEIISGLSCFDDRKHAYQLAWERLDRRFGNQTS